MSRFVGDPEDFRKPGGPRRLVVTSDLLLELGVGDSPRPEQEQAVRQWLTENEPPKVLAVSLRDDGFLSAAGNRAAG